MQCAGARSAGMQRIWLKQSRSYKSGSCGARRETELPTKAARRCGAMRADTSRYRIGDRQRNRKKLCWMQERWGWGKGGNQGHFVERRTIGVSHVGPEVESECRAEREYTVEGRSWLSEGAESSRVDSMPQVRGKRDRLLRYKS